MCKDDCAYCNHYYHNIKLQMEIMRNEINQIKAKLNKLGDGSGFHTDRK